MVLIGVFMVHTRFYTRFRQSVATTFMKLLNCFIFGNLLLRIEETQGALTTIDCVSNFH